MNAQKQSKMSFVTRHKLVALYVGCVLLLVLFMLFLEMNLPSGESHTSKSVASITHSDADANEQSSQSSIKSMMIPDDSSYSSIMIYCMVPTIWPENRQRLTVISDTWAPLCDRLYWVVDSTPKTRAALSLLKRDDRTGDYLFRNRPFLMLNITGIQSRAARNIWEKMWKTWRWLGRNTVAMNEGQWFLKVDDDTFFSPIQFKGFAQYFQKPEYKAYWLGHTLLHKWKRDNTIFNSGICYALSRQSIKELSQRVWDSQDINEHQWFHDPPDQIRQEIGVYCTSRDGALEDQSMGVCMRSIGVPPSNTIDNYGRQRFHLFKSTDMIRIKREDTWFWQYKPRNIGTGTDGCCSVNSIAFHAYKQGEIREMMPLHLFYNNLTRYPHLNSPLFEKPNNLGQFEFDLTSLDFEFRDDYQNKKNPPKMQRIYEGPNRKRVCWDC